MSVLPRAIFIVASLAFAPLAAAQPVLPGPGGGGAQPAPPSGPAPAPGGLLTKITPQQLAQLYSGLTNDGQAVQVSVKTFDDGSSVVVLPLWGTQLWSGVGLEYCEKDGSGCTKLHFFLNMGKQPTVNANWINAFNRKYIGVKVYTLDNGELDFTYDLPLGSGITSDYILWTTRFFKVVVDESFKFKPS